jgi:hypothetical protein
MKTVVVYHKADCDGIFCREIAKKFRPHAELIGWDYGDPEPVVAREDSLYILDLSVPGLMTHPNLVWIDHHKSAMDKYGSIAHGYRIDGVAACRLAWFWFAGHEGADLGYFATKGDFVNRQVAEPLAVRLAGEYDIWDKRDPRAELFQHGLRSQELTELHWELLLHDGKEGDAFVETLLEQGAVLQYARTRENESIIKSAGFTIQFEGLCFLACNHAHYNSFLFTAGLKPEHDACLGFCWRGGRWTVSLYHAPGKEHHDLSQIAAKYGGGGHKGACGFQIKSLPFLS